MENDFQFISPFVKASDLPNGQPVLYTTRRDQEDGKVWGYRPSEGQFACEVLMNGEKVKVEFFLNLSDPMGLEKKFTRNSKGFWDLLQKLNLQEGEKVQLLRIGEGKNARYSVVRMPTAATAPEKKSRAKK